MKTFDERPRIVTVQIEVRASDGQPATIAGYGAVFGSETVIAGMFRERIEPGAFRNAVTQADIRGTFDHDLVLGRTTNGTLRLSEDARGLRYEITPNPKDTAAMDALARVQRGDVTGSSFGFKVAKDGDKWIPAVRSGDMPLRVISEFALIRDVGPVSYPAYDDTTAEARSEAAALIPASMRATATGLTPDAAEEQAELVQYQALKDMLDQITALVAKAAPVVDSLISDETEDPTETVEAEAAEEDIEQARLNVLRAHGQLLCGAASAFASLTCGLRDGGYGYYSAKNATERARIDLMELD